MESNTKARIKLAVLITVFLVGYCHAALDWEEVQTRDGFKDVTPAQWNYLIKTNGVRTKTDFELSRMATMFERKFYARAAVPFTAHIDHEGLTALQIGTEYLAQLAARQTKIARMLTFYAYCKKEQDLRAAL